MTWWTKTPRSKRGSMEERGQSAQLCVTARGFNAGGDRSPLPTEPELTTSTPRDPSGELRQGTAQTRGQGPARPVRVPGLGGAHLRTELENEWRLRSTGPLAGPRLGSKLQPASHARAPQVTSWRCSSHSPASQYSSNLNNAMGHNRTAAPFKV